MTSILQSETTPVTASGEDEESPQLTPNGRRALTATLFMGLCGLLLLVFILGATWANASMEPPRAVPVNLVWAEQTFDKVLVAFLGMLSLARARIT